MVIEIYGRQNCQLCENARKKIAHFLDRWEFNGSVRLVFQDIDTAAGAAESDFYDVFRIPSVLLKKGGDEVVARWDGKAPPSEELHQRLSA
jgi:hypothetical protein